MYNKLTFRKLANHWYLDIPHDTLSDISLCPKAERMLDMLDEFKSNEVEIILEEVVYYIPEDYILQFEEPDITRWFTTDDFFYITVYINGHDFKITSELYSLLEQKYEFKFHENIYKVELI